MGVEREWVRTRIARKGLRGRIHPQAEFGVVLGIRDIVDQLDGTGETNDVFDACVVAGGKIQHIKEPNAECEAEDELQRFMRLD